MNDHLKQFATHSAYEAVKNNLDTPNVVLCTQEDEVHYNPYVDPFNGHAYVDLGLPSGTLWATMNVGANAITDYGDYYQYGSGASYTTDYQGDENPLDSSRDTATQIWGGDWHMPTMSQLAELVENTTYEAILNYQGSGVNVGTFTANGQILVIPLAGYYNYAGLVYDGDQSIILSSTPYNEDHSIYYHVYTLDPLSNNNVNVGFNSRAYMYSVRPVVG